MWHQLAQSLWKTWRHVEFGDEYKPEELLAIAPGVDVSLLRRELTQAEVDTTPAGKLFVDKAPAGSKSPNLADSMVICYSAGTSWTQGMLSGV